MATIRDCFTCWDTNLPTWDAAAQAICSCTFGRRDDAANMAMANKAARRCIDYEIPYCVQGEIGDLLQSAPAFPRIHGITSAHSLDVHSENYVSTYHTVKQQCEEFLNPQGITKIHVDAMWPHAWRVVQTYRLFDKEVVSCDTEDIPWPELSSQRWCRSGWNYLSTFPYPPFYPYEVAARLISLRRGWL